MVEITFANPKWLYLLLLLIPMLAFYVFRQMNASASLQMSSIKGFAGNTNSLKTYPTMSFFKWLYYTFIEGMEDVLVLV